MNDLYLCERGLATTPYYLEEVTKNIYSLEELSYFLLHNVILLDKSFMSPGLCRWIGEACGYKELGAALKKKLRDNCTLSEFAAAILTENGFCSRREIDDVNYLLRQMEEKSDFERSKIRADKLMENNRYINSIYEYKRMLKMRTAKEQNSILLASVWHNLGCAYAKMLFFREAEDCFEIAYSMNGKKSSLSKMLLAALCRHDEEDFTVKGKKYLVSERSLDMLRSEYRRAVNTEETHDFREKLDRLEVKGTDDRRAFLSEIGELINEWKEEYRNFCRI